MEMKLRRSVMGNEYGGLLQISKGDIVISVGMDSEHHYTSPRWEKNVAVSEFEVACLNKGKMDYDLLSRIFQESDIPEEFHPSEGDVAGFVPCEYLSNLIGWLKKY